MELYYSDKFKKSIPFEKKSSVDKLILRLRKQLKESNEGIFGTFRKSQTVKFAGTDRIFKFRVDDGDRIIFTYISFLENCRADEEGIYLIKYVSHDKQNIIAKKIELSDVETINIWSAEEDFSLEFEELNKEEKTVYQDPQYFNLENFISYWIQHDDSFKEIIENARINSEQFNYIQKNNPLLIIGGAGSGKTLVAIHKLNSYFSYSEISSHLCYITFSNNLCKSARKIFDQISTDKSKDILFTTLNQYCMKKLNIKEKDFVEYERFEDWFIKTHRKKTSIDIDIVDIWAEIRGIIKGYMGTEWKRNYPFDFRDLPNNETTKYLKNKGYIVEVDNNPQILRSTILNDKDFKSAIQNIETDDDCNDKPGMIASIKSIYERAITFQYDEKLIPFTDYLSLDQQASIFSREEREKIYSICQDYQNWLDIEGQFDDNDLAGLLMEQRSNLETFDYIVVDEVQDLTELQIFLISNLVKDLNHLTFAGDIHQIINPTYYRNDRLRKLYFINNNSLEIGALTKNFRSQKHIIDLANTMGEIRKKFIAQEKQVTEQRESAMIEGNMIFALKANKENLKKMLNAIKENPNAAVIVSDEGDRRALESELGVEIANIFTIQEVKGLEFHYVFCYNLTGKYNHYWKDIFGGRGKKNAKYRYFFNLFYVAITRAKSNLCIYEKDSIFLERDSISRHFLTIDKFDEDILGLKDEEVSPEKWEEIARELEEKDRLEKAIEYYKKAHSSKTNIERCKAKLAAKKGDYDLAIDMLLNVLEYDLAKDYAEKAGNVDKSIVAYILSEEANSRKVDEKYGSTKVLSAVAKHIAENKFADELYNKYFKRKTNHIQDQFVMLKEEINQVGG